MALLINTNQKCKDLSKFSKYVVYFFYDSSKMEVSQFRKEFAPLLKEVRMKQGFKCAQFDQKKVDIPKAQFGFSSEKGIIFYRSGVYLTYMCDFDPGKFKDIIVNIDKKDPVYVPGAKTVEVKVKKTAPKADAKTVAKVKVTMTAPKTNAKSTAKTNPDKTKKDKTKKDKTSPHTRTVKLFGMEATFTYSSSGK